MHLNSHQESDTKSKTYKHELA